MVLDQQPDSGSGQCHRSSQRWFDWANADGSTERVDQPDIHEFGQSDLRRYLYVSRQPVD